MRLYFFKQVVFRVHTSRSHFTANSGYKETPATPSMTNSGLRHMSQRCPLKLLCIHFSVSLLNVSVSMNRLKKAHLYNSDLYKIPYHRLMDRK